ncbi:hypothetical protein HGG70_05100 [Rhodobacteraceae bacterium R_SAG4]|nr:hypothetical protein [Rhodobacteraceae bacterium R_SAG4]
MNPRQTLRALKEILKDMGLPESVETSHRHPKVIIVGPLGQRKVTVSSSPSDHRALMNIRTDIRRVAREVGALVA